MPDMTTSYGMYLDFISVVSRRQSLSLSSSYVVGVVICVLAPAYTSFCRGLEYSPKVRYIILVNPNEAGFLIFDTIVLDRMATVLPYV